MRGNEPQFGLILRRPGPLDENGEAPVFLAPDFATPRDRYTTAAGSDPRERTFEASAQWSLSLPHRCDEWNIGYGARAEVLADALALRAELDQVITALSTPSTDPREP